jgi:hypothetical protein
VGIPSSFLIQIDLRFELHKETGKSKNQIAASLRGLRFVGTASKGDGIRQVDAPNSEERAQSYS